MASIFSLCFDLLEGLMMMMIYIVGNLFHLFPCAMPSVPLETVNGIQTNDRFLIWVVKIFLIISKHTLDLYRYLLNYYSFVNIFWFISSICNVVLVSYCFRSFHFIVLVYFSLFFVLSLVFAVSLSFKSHFPFKFALSISLSWRIPILSPTSFVPS